MHKNAQFVHIIVHLITTHLRNQVKVWFTGTYLFLECLTKTEAMADLKGRVPYYSNDDIRTIDGVTTKL